MPRPLVAFHTLKFASDLLHFRREASILFVLFVLLPVPINRRGMDGNESDQTGLQVDELTAFFGNKNRLAQNGLGCRCSHTNHDLRPQGLELGLQPRLARRDLSDRGLLMQPPFAAPYPLKMLDCVGHINFTARNSSLNQRLVKQTPRGSDEGMALPIFLISGLFSYKDDAGFLRSLTEHRLRGVLV